MNDFLKTYQHVPVETYDNTVAMNPMVSVCIQTYQQERTISSCLEGILEQKTTFDYEILIAEDQSSDKTREICIFFAEKYPDKIRLFLHSRKNNIRIDGRASGRFNYIYNLLNTRGKYIAFCEGDDYWNNPEKLQKQVDFMESNPDFGLIHTDNLIYDEISNKTILFQKSTRYSGNEIFEQLLFKNHITTATVLARSSTYHESFEFLYKNIGIEMIMDYSLWLCIAMNSKIKHLPEITALYRFSENSASRPEKKEQQYQYIKKIFDIRMRFCELTQSGENIIKVIKINYYRKKLYYAFKNYDKLTVIESLEKIKNLTGKVILNDWMKYMGSKYKILNYLFNKIDKK